MASTPLQHGLEPDECPVIDLQGTGVLELASKLRVLVPREHLRGSRS